MGWKESSRGGDVYHKGIQGPLLLSTRSTKLSKDTLLRADRTSNHDPVEQVGIDMLGWPAP